MSTAKRIGLWLMLGMMLTVAACDNTIRGVGRDAQESGDAIEDSVE